MVTNRNKTATNKILIITTYLKPINMGGGSNAAAFADYLQKQKHKVTILSKTNTGILKRMKNNNIAVRWPNSRLLKVLSLCWIFPLTLFFCIKNETIIVISPHYPLVSVNILIARTIGKNVIFRSTLLGDDDPKTLYDDNTLKSRIILKAMERANIYHAINPAFTQSYEQIFGFKNNVIEITQGINLNIFNPKSNQNEQKFRQQHHINDSCTIILSVGFLINRKGLKQMADILQGIREDYIYIIVGDYKLPNNHPLFWLEHEIRSNYEYIKMKLGNKVRFLGSIKNMKEVYASADILFMNSDAEGTPNVLLEAMASGVVSVVKELPGYRNFLIEDEVTGFLFNTAATATAAITNLCKNKNVLKTISKNSWMYAYNNFGFETTAKKLDLL